MADVQELKEVGCNWNCYHDHQTYIVGIWHHQTSWKWMYIAAALYHFRSAISWQSNMAKSGLNSAKEMDSKMSTNRFGLFRWQSRRVRSQDHFPAVVAAHFLFASAAGTAQAECCSTFQTPGWELYGGDSQDLQSAFWTRCHSYGSECYSSFFLSQFLAQLTLWPDLSHHRNTSSGWHTWGHRSHQLSWDHQQWGWYRVWRAPAAYAATCSLPTTSLPTRSDSASWCWYYGAWALC